MARAEGRRNSIRNKEVRQWKKNDVHLPQPRKKSSYSLHLFFIFPFSLIFLCFRAFRNKGVQKYEKQNHGKRSVAHLAKHVPCG
jgi:hypothetical protein